MERHPSEPDGRARGLIVRLFRPRSHAGFAARVSVLGRDDFHRAAFVHTRVRNWTGRGIRRTNYAGFVMGFGDPESVRLLLNAPEEEKPGGVFFDRVLAIDPIGLRQIALDAAAGPWLRAVENAKTSRFPLLNKSTRDPVRLAAGSVLKGSYVRELYGAKWWLALTRAAMNPKNTEAVRRLWNALAVDGLARSIDALA